jgi:transposase
MIMLGRPRIKVKTQQEVKELKEHYQRCTCAVERRRTQAIWWLVEGKTAKEVLELSAYSAKNLVDIVKRYNHKGLEGLKDGRHENPGAVRLLSDPEMLLLAQTIRKDYRKGVVWKGKQIVAWVKEELGKDIHEQRAYEFMRDIAFTLQQPRPAHVKSDPIQQEEFKKKPYPKRSKTLLRAMGKTK